MPQISTKPQEARKIISASIPKNISAVDREKLEKNWNDAAAKRAEAIQKETRIPTEPTIILKYELRKFGRHWNGYARDKKGKLIPLLPAPSLLSSAKDAILDRMESEAIGV